MKENFVPYEIALLAKQKKFNGDCIAYYHNHVEYSFIKDIDRGIVTNNFEQNLYASDCAAPLYQQLIDWLFEEHNIHIRYYCVFATPDWWDYSIEIRNSNEPIITAEEESFKTKQECLNSAIIKALNLLTNLK